MKILKIKALNINSLKGELEIDFRTFLNDNALFAITGPTGSGKSTILDIITCALYGRTPRLKKPPDELMSRHTGECYCEVEFEIKGKVYRSSWAIKRARKSPEGKFQSAKMELSDVETSKVIKSTLSDVPKYVEELSGLDFDRFKQSMVLAQGGFDAFLKADEKERSTLLEKMTGTQIYKQISLEIYDRYSSHKADIDLDKNILESTQLLDSKELEDKIKALADKTKEKLEYDKKEKELIQIKTWLETLDKLEADNIKYTELFTSISKEKEDNKESFRKLALSTKALNVEVLYTKHNTLEIVLEKDKANHILLLSELDDLNKVLKSLDSSYIVLLQDSRKAKEHFDTQTKKIKELRTLETQIHEKEKSLAILIKHIESKQSEANTFNKDLEAISREYSSIEDKSKVLNAYIQSNSKDEKLIELLPLVKKNIEEYKSHNTSLSDIQKSHKLLIKEQSLQNNVVEVLDKESKDLKAIYVSINKDYTLIEAASAHDSIEEESLRLQVKKQESLEKSYFEYIEYKKTIVKELASKACFSKEQSLLKQSIQTKEALVNELKVHITTLREKKETELLIKKYEEDRASLKEGEQCFLCGSSEHPYIEDTKDVQKYSIVDTNKTINQINEKEQVLSKEEKDLSTQAKSLTQIESKIESILLEVKKLEEYQKTLADELQKASIDIRTNEDEVILSIQEELEAQNTKLTTIKQRRADKDLLLKQRDNANVSYTLILSEFIEKEKDLTKILSNIKQISIDEEKHTTTIHSIKKELQDQYKQYSIEFDDLTYEDKYEVLHNKKETYILKQNHKKDLDLEKNQKALQTNELETKLAALQTLLDTELKTKINHESFIKEQKDKSTSILNIANIDLYEIEVNTSYKTIQDEVNSLGKELTKTKTKDEELQKQEALLKELIKSNKLSCAQEKQKLDTELAINDFESIEVFKKAILPKDVREELSLFCISLEDKYKEYQTLKINTSKALEEHKEKENIKSKVIAEVAQELQVLQEKIDQVQENIGALSQTLKRNEDDSKQHQKKIQELEKKKEAFKVWVKLNEMIGSADGNKFAKFAQGITLDQLISLANNHLILLSSRYELQRSSEQKQVLEIEVIDSFQGNVLRPVSTLSGGESFIVSLALALGLSELASQKISIDSLFLDEGFGTLDEDSLETALNALNLLQSRGKMVGVISHVEALKERIPLQIRVVPKGDGTSFVEI